MITKEWDRDIEKSMVDEELKQHANDLYIISGGIIWYGKEK